ncbi:MAG: hypothetical protein PHD74_03575 [Candidatus Krumholzibacteria bacterium]|nr:hypothetical protein [Candidatus Krumholzibacteria bacterium]
MKVLKSLGCIAAILVCSAPAFPQTGIRYTIHWSPVTGADVSQVLIYRSSVDKDNNFVPIGSAASSETTYTDTDASLEYDVTYWYRLKSQNATGTAGSFSTNVVSALSISDEASESFKGQCRIDSVVTVDSVTCRVYWTTAVASTGRLWYRRVGESTVLETETASNLATRHDLLLEGLAENSTYIVRAVTRDQSGMALTISASESFTTSSSSANFEIVASAGSVVVPEGGTATLGVKLSAQPSDAVELTLERSSGDTDISIQSGSMQQSLS